MLSSMIAMLSPGHSGSGIPAFISHLTSSRSLLAVILLPVLVVAYAFYRLYDWDAHSTNLQFVPMPSGASYIWGHQKVVFSRSAGLAYTEWFHALKCSVIRIRGALWKPDILVVTDPMAISYLMNKKIYDYHHSDVSRPRIARMLGRSLGWVEGESEHKRMRQLVTPSLSSEAIKRGAHKIYEAAETLRENLHHAVQSEKNDLVIDVTEWMQQATLDAIGRFAFGHDFGGGKNEEAAGILGAWRHMAKVAISLKGFYGLMLLRRLPLLNQLPLAVLHSQGNVRRTIQAGIAEELLRRNGALAASAQDLPDDMLFDLLKAHNDKSISREELLDHVVMFTIAGSETTAQGLSYALWELARNPDIQNRLRDELSAFSSEPKYEEIQSGMPYLDAVTREILRLHPPTPYMERNAVEDDIIPLRHPLVDRAGKVHTEIQVKAGQTIIVPIHTVNQLDTVWGDGSVFRPERWMTDSLPPHDLLSGGWSNILTFSDGPRICTGYRLAIFEFKLFLAFLVQSFQFFDTGVEITDRYASTVNPVVVGKEEDGPLLPIRITAVEN